ncbi:MAG: hypothetical protein LUF89_03555 [Ruminococcus sp.]|nr:hypothetical protein [Ruminococcus sp.]
MIPRVRNKFVIITMSILTAMLLILLIALNFITKMVTYNQTANTLEQIAISEIQAWEEDYDSPDGMPDDTPPSRRENGDSTEEKYHRGRNRECDDYNKYRERNNLYFNLFLCGRKR